LLPTISTPDETFSTLEWTFIALGLTSILWSLPVDWLTLWFDLPYMPLYRDVCQIFFYWVLFCFWIINTGEYVHILDSEKKNESLSKDKNKSPCYLTSLSACC